MASNTGFVSSIEPLSSRKDFSSRCLLLQRLPKFVEQSRVLDGNDSLVGEGLDQFDLLRFEWPYGGAVEYE
jgi:hypothetical protein